MVLSMRTMRQKQHHQVCTGYFAGRHPEHGNQLAYDMSLGALPPGTSIETTSDGRLMLGGAPLPPGSQIVTNPDGTKSISGSVPESQHGTLATD